MLAIITVISSFISKMHVTDTFVPRLLIPNFEEPVSSFLMTDLSGISPQPILP